MQTSVSDGFAARYKAALEGIANEEDDKSRKGSVDAPIRDLVSDINTLGKGNVFTTSSCSGRVSLVAEESGMGVKRVKGDAKWIFMSHEPVTSEQVWKAMESYTAAFSEGSQKGKEETLTFRFEPFILAVECATLDVAKEVVKVGRETGFRESGLHISNRLIVSIRCSIRLELPVVKNGQLLVSKEYVDHITMLSCEKFTDNFKRIDRFHMLLRSRLVALRAHEGAGRSKETSHPGPSPDDSSVWAVQVDKRKAKPLKDFLKRQKWLHKSIKPVVSDGKVAFPLTAAGKEKYPFQEFDPQPLDDSEAHTLIQLDEDSRKANLTKTPLSPYERLRRAVSHFLGKDPESVVSKDYFETLMNDLPSKWERLGDALLIPSKYMVDEYWYKEKNKVVWETISSALQCQKIGRQRAVVNNAIRESGAELIWPTEKAAAADGHVKHLENGILFCFDFTKCMFSSGNVTEKARVAAFDCRNEVVVDMFAGIGYYTLPYLVKARAKHVYACEWNPEALKALRRNLKENGVEDKCTILEGDCTVHAPAGIANRVNLGLIPSSEVAWSAAVRSLRPEGGWLHVHMNCLEDEIHSFVKKMTESLTNLAHDQDKRANVFCVRHVEKVKWYAPKVRHIVVDIECKVCGGLLPSSEEKKKSMERNRSPVRKFPPAKSLEVLEAKDEGLLSSHISSSREPLLFRGLDVGQDNWLWTKEGLMSLDPSDTTPVSVHVSDVSTLDFVHKNFEYSKMSLQAFLKATETENVYLRCLGKDPRKEPASLPKSFPQLASVFKMPQVVEESKIFSTVLRVASEGLALWTHYDVMDNLLIQMHGRKRVLLFPPECRKDLYVVGSSSPVLDLDDQDSLKEYPAYENAREKALEVMMEPGDVLFIPALWFHSIKNCDFSVAVNTFFRHLPQECYERKDVYGNKDLAVFNKAMEILQKVKDLPEVYSKFYRQQLTDFIK